MKRFYKEAAPRPVENGYEILLDKKLVKTPGRKRLVVPTSGLAEAIAAEWNAQGDKIDPRSMPLTGLANAAIDRAATDHEGFARTLARFGESDLLCYRADSPNALISRQSKLWDPVLAWARRRFDVDFETVRGIVHRPQPPATLERLERAVLSKTAFELAALSPLVTISGSLLIGLALAEDGLDLDKAWEAATLDEAWQTEHWGEDEEAAAALEARRRDFEAAHRFLKLL